MKNPLNMYLPMLCYYCHFNIPIEDETILGDLPFHKKCADKWLEDIEYHKNEKNKN